MHEMSRVSWISLCLLVVGAAIPLVELRVTIETNDTDFKSEENVMILVDDDTGSQTLLGRVNECENCNVTHFKKAKSRSGMMDFIYGSDNFTRHLHSGMKRIYRTYKQGTASVNSDNLISSVSTYMKQYVPSLSHSNTTFKHKRRAHFVNTNHSYYEHTDMATDDNNNAFNSSIHLRRIIQMKKQMIRNGLENIKTEVEDNSTLVESTDTASNDSYNAFNSSIYLGQIKQMKKQMVRYRLENIKTEIEDNSTLVENTDTASNDSYIAFNSSIHTENTDTISSNAKSSNTMPDEVTVDEYSKCQHVPGFNELRWIKMVVLCPKIWPDSETQLKCEFWQDLNAESIMDELTFLPVQDQNGTVYANVYCAQCHNVTFLLPWVSRFDCNKTSQHTYQVSDFTNLDFLYTNLLTSTCQRDIIPAIPHTLVECPTEAQPFMGSRKGLNVEEDVLSASYPVSFSVIMNFDFTGNTHILFTANQKIVEEEYTTKCQVGETFDPYTNSCRQLTCNTDYILVGSNCVQTAGTSSSVDDITDLSQLRTVHIVTLQLNITFGEFLLLRYQVVEPEIVQQIAGYLNISVERLKDLNITYELGSISGRPLQVRPLTDDEYRGMLQENPIHNISSSRVTGPDGKTTSVQPKASDGKDDRSQPAITDKTISKSKNKKDRFKTRMNTTVPETKSGLKPVAVPMKSSVQGRKFFTRSPANFTFANSLDFGEIDGQHQTINGKAKVKPVSKYNVDLMKSVHANVSRHKLAASKKLFQQTFKYRGKEVSTKYATFVRYHFKYPANNTVMYISGPVNENNERVSLLIPESQSLQLLLEQSMVMKISLFLVPPEDSQSNEAETRDILRKMDSLIFEQQFSLKLNGNDVDVVAVNDLTEDNEEVAFCPLGVEYLVYDDEFMVVDMDNTTVLFDNKTNSFVRLGMFDLFLVVSGSNQAGQTNFTEMTQYAFVCFMPRISEHNCDMIDLDHNEYRVAGENKSIIFEDKQYDIFQYRFLDQSTGSIQICVPSTFVSRNATVHSYVTTIDISCSGDFEVVLRAEGYMTLVLGRVSIAALACVLITYILFRSLRNLPGLNLMNLTFALLVTQIIFASGIEENKSQLCKFVAVSLHYTLLAAHFWMNVVSYDVYKTFTDPTIQNRARGTRKYFYRYVLYAWGAPLVIVSLCMLLDFSHLISGVSIGYGAELVSPDELNFRDDNITATQEVATSINDTSVTDEQTIHTCWITQPLAALIAFGAIILLIFLINCIFFGKTIACISKTAKMAKKSLGNRNSNSSVHRRADTSEVMLYVRMSTVMGFTWIFGLSSSILSSFVSLPTYIACTVVHILSLLFIILNTSQGFLIFIAFVCNRRVLALYRHQFHKIKLLMGRSSRSGLFTVSSMIYSSQNNSTGQVSNK